MTFWRRPRWARVPLVAVCLGVVALLSDLTDTAQLSGQANVFLAVRLSVSKFVNAGSVWAAAAVVSGWWLHRPRAAAAAGVVACEVTLLSHYALGRALGAFDGGVWSDNAGWFVVALAFGPLLGLLGAAAHRPGGGGWVASLVVPVGAVAEPLVLGWFTPPAAVPWPVRVASVVAGVSLIVASAMLLMVITRHRRVVHTAAPAVR